MRSEPPPRVVERLKAASFVVDGSDCVETTYSTGSHGYGQIGWYTNGKRSMQVVHRVAWFAAFGDIPIDMVVDHVCRNRRCVNVDHLRLLTNAANASDTATARRTHCPAGHSYDDINTYVGPTGGRRCRTCAKERQRAA